MNIKQMLEEHIRIIKKTMITLEELESLFVGARIEAHEFASAILELEKADVLDAVKSAGRTTKQPSLAYRYRVSKHQLNQPYIQQLQQFRLSVHPAIQLDGYFLLSPEEFQQDKPWIELIDLYCKRCGMPTEAVAAPERSYQLTGNEKWITDLGGYALLKRLGLWDRLLVYPVSDPLMLAVNPSLLKSLHQSRCIHVIVENKTTFQALLPALSESSAHTLIYGCGNKITGNIDMFPQQYPLADCEHHFYYFGDLDYEGIRIWHETNKKRPMRPAVPFYEACLARPSALGKTNQRRNDEAVQAFLNHFPQSQREQLEHCFSSGGYYPQETLTARQLQQIWRSERWKQWIDSN